jgi:hypothetical protein
LGTQHPKRDLFACLREDMFVLPSASLISRQAFQAVDGFDERLMGYEDDDLFLRLFRRGYDNVYLGDRLSRWRIYMASASYSPRMSRSRMIYAKKLLDEFPDDPDRVRYVRRDLLAPRFFAQMVGEYRKALRRGDSDQIRPALDNLLFISKYLRFRLRIIVTLVAPLLRYWPLAKVLFAAGGVARPVARWVLMNRLPPTEVGTPRRYSTAAAFAASAQVAVDAHAKPQSGSA